MAPAKTAFPLWIGLRAARANLWPGLCLQLVMLLIVIAFYRAGWTRPWFDKLALAKASGGWFFSMAAAVIAGAILPELLRIIFFQRGAASVDNLWNLAFGVVFWALNGLSVDCFYRAQAAWFGSEPTVVVLMKKVAVDQFVYSAFFSVPLTVWGYEWRNRRYRLHGLGDFFTTRFYAEKILPTTVANWSVWIPGTALIYSLPTLLQIPLFSLALTFWSLILSYINAGKDDPQSLVPGVSVG